VRLPAKLWQLQTALRLQLGAVVHLQQQLQMAQQQRGSSGLSCDRPFQERKHADFKISFLLQQRVRERSVICFSAREDSSGKSQSILETTRIFQLTG
jgi:hypothetical protein